MLIALFLLVLVVFGGHSLWVALASGFHPFHAAAQVIFLVLVFVLGLKLISLIGKKG